MQHPAFPYQFYSVPANPDVPKRTNPLLFVHGAWHNARCWTEHFVPAFAELGYDCFAPSLRGHGLSGNDRSLRLTRIKHYVEDIEIAVAKLGRAPILIGHSMGGLVTQHYFAKHNVTAAVLLASVPHTGVLRATLRAMAKMPVPFLTANLTLSLKHLVKTPEQARALFYSADFPADQLLKHHSILQDESYAAYLDMMVFARPAPKPVQFPLLVVGGENDFIFSPEEVHATAAAYGTTATIMPNMAHNLMIERDWQRVYALIAAWLDDNNL